MLLSTGLNPYRIDTSSARSHTVDSRSSFMAPSYPLPVRALLLLILAPLAACSPDAPALPSTPEATPPRVASADTVDVQGVARVRASLEGDVTGSITLRAINGGTRVLMSLDGLDQDSQQGVQILSARSCERADPSVHLGDSRAPHGPYGAPAGRRHAGDLGNINGDDRGQGRYDRIDPILSLSGYLSPVGRAVVVRQRQDDGWTQPDGASGGVVGCGVFQPTP